MVVGIIWLWATLFVATLYPIFDGGYQQIMQVYRGLRGQQQSPVGSSENGKVVQGESSSPENGSVSDGVAVKESKAT